MYLRDVYPSPSHSLILLSLSPTRTLTYTPLDYSQLVRVGQSRRPQIILFVLSDSGSKYIRFYTPRLGGISHRHLVQRLYVFRSHRFVVSIFFSGALDLFTYYYTVYCQALNVYPATERKHFIFAACISLQSFSCHRPDLTTI